MELSYSGSSQSGLSQTVIVDSRKRAHTSRYSELSQADIVSSHKQLLNDSELTQTDIVRGLASNSHYCLQDLSLYPLWALIRAVGSDLSLYPVWALIQAVGSELTQLGSASPQAFPAGRSGQEPLLSDHNQTKQQPPMGGGGGRGGGGRGGGRGQGGERGIGGIRGRGENLSAIAKIKWPAQRWGRNLAKGCCRRRV